MHGEQLLDLRLLEELAQKLQSLDCQVIILPNPIPSVAKRPCQVHLYSTRRDAKCPRLERPHLHVCRTLARSVIQTPRVGVVSQLVPCPRVDC